MRTSLIYHPIYLEHKPVDHVENPERLIAIMSLLEESGLTSQLKLLSPRAASVEEVSTVHSLEYVNSIRLKAEGGGGWLNPDTYVSPASFDAALYAAGGVITGVDAVMNGEADAAFALVRPPGHHATCWQGLGFCIFNNVAIGTKHALANYGLSRILIVDFDVHHGNGTQDCFYADGHVLYFSTHQYPWYPGTGSVQETGTGAGEGLTLNVPLLGGWGDEEYLRVFKEVLKPAAERYQPQLILVSAGYDAHWIDPISSMQVTVDGFADLVYILGNISRQLALERIVFSLEGGYHHQALASSVKATLEVLMGKREVEDPIGSPPNPSKPPGFEDFLKMIKSTHGL